ncbi:hypothetical protein [Almyronema epifaneia]|uniref:Uncharacterized protein n=1 Tax=Almyronema epifaneia S1 TaxID=2991925 RepID=A0ABW6IBZ5_9CYAN
MSRLLTAIATESKPRSPDAAPPEDEHLADLAAHQCPKQHCCRHQR